MPIYQRIYDKRISFINSIDNMQFLLLAQRTPGACFNMHICISDSRSTATELTEFIYDQ